MNHDSDIEVDLSDGLYRRIFSSALRGHRINSVSLLAELLFWRLHLVADDFGLFSAEPGDLLHEVFPRRPDITEEQVSDALAELERQPPLIRRYTFGGDRYGQIIDFLRYQPAGKNGRRVRRFPIPPVNPGESKVIQGDPGELVQSTPEHLHLHTHKQKQNQNQAADTASGELPFSSKEFIEAWARWNQHRQEIRKPLRDAGRTAQFKKLAAIGEARAIAAIDHSIASGWQGIFEADRSAPAKPTFRLPANWQELNDDENKDAK